MPAQRRIPPQSFFLFLACLVMAAGVQAEAASRWRRRQETPPGLASMRFEGRRRTYLVHLPPSFDRRTKRPLVLALPGGGGDAAHMVELTFGEFDRLADQEGFVVVYPEAVKFPFAKRNWNDGREFQEYPAQRLHVNDAGFLSALIDRLITQLNVDPDRVYATGISNGALMSNLLACEHAEQLAAIAPVAGSIAEPAAPRCHPSRPVSVLMINGTADPLVPWEGGSVHFGRKGLGTILSVSDTVAFWVRHDGCDPTPQRRDEPDRDPTDGTRVRRDAYSGCQGGAEVALYSVVGGGHTWPGGEQYLPASLVGRTSRDLDGTQAIWEFFRRHHR